MKTHTLFLAIAMLLAACQPKKENNAEEEIAIDLSPALMELSEPAACSAPPVLETVKFSPPVIKDDAVETDVFNSGTNFPQKHKKIIFKQLTCIKKYDKILNCNPLSQGT